MTGVKGVDCSKIASNVTIGGVTNLITTNMRHHHITHHQVGRSSLLSGRNVRWPRRMLCLVTHQGVTVSVSTGQTDGRTAVRYIMFSAMDTASVTSNAR